MWMKRITLESIFFRSKINYKDFNYYDNTYSEKRTIWKP